jgi:hypothetical protein
LGDIHGTVWLLIMSHYSIEKLPMESSSDHTPDSRPYLHEKCGGVTIISGYQFGRITNPFHYVPQTMCAECQKAVSLKSVAWVDTGEPISRYRRRMWRASPRALKTLAYIGPFVCIALGVGIAMLLPPQKVPAHLAFGIGGLILGLVLLPVALSGLWGIDFRGVK